MQVALPDRAEERRLVAVGEVLLEGFLSDVRAASKVPRPWIFPSVGSTPAPWIASITSTTSPGRRSRSYAVLSPPTEASWSSEAGTRSSSTKQLGLVQRARERGRLVELVLRVRGVVGRVHPDEDLDVVGVPGLDVLRRLVAVLQVEELLPALLDRVGQQRPSACAASSTAGPYSSSVSTPIRAPTAWSATAATPR